MILIFEDNMDIALVLKRILNSSFHERCVITCNCAVAENMVLAGEIELVLSDLNIEGREGQGLDLIRKIKKFKPHTSPPIVVFTGLSKGDSTYNEAEGLSDRIFEKSEIPLPRLCKEICSLMKLGGHPSHPTGQEGRNSYGTPPFPTHLHPVG
jgi:DNA-binding NtrC family response regulator